MLLQLEILESLSRSSSPTHPAKSRAWDVAARSGWRYSGDRHRMPEPSGEPPHRLEPGPCEGFPGQPARALVVLQAPERISRMADPSLTRPPLGATLSAPRPLGPLDILNTITGAGGRRWMPHRATGERSSTLAASRPTGNRCAGREYDSPGTPDSPGLRARRDVP